ncbi:uncharacterized protein B0T23DRAFT_132069 [Neurospora hispaniola]|uniref:Secreted protein n=1 Tax=Neurospora hispaniola TaxID=588809 RepID=A0AAJ0IBF2_9PEZI|nr:hypothetical protein B0T23DRAFT_132069 [Neurospora hispaniola]
MVIDFCIHFFFSFSIAALRPVCAGTEILLCEPPFLLQGLVPCDPAACTGVAVFAQAFLPFISTALNASGHRFLHASGCTENVGSQALQSR